MAEKPTNKAKINNTNLNKSKEIEFVSTASEKIVNNEKINQDQKNIDNKNNLNKNGISSALLADFIAKKLFFITVIIPLIITGAIFIILFINSWGFFKKVSLFEFITKTEWSPFMDNPKYGVLALVSGTLLTTVVAATISIPLGVISAIYIAEYAGQKIRKCIKLFLETVSGIPSIVYGYYAITWITPMIQRIFPQTDLLNGLSGGIAVGIMILPFVTSLSEESLSAVPKSLREASFALGSTKLETTLKVVLPTAFSGIAAAFLLAISRAIGETMVVTVASGSTPNFRINPFGSMQTMTSFIVQVTRGDNPQSDISFNSLFAVGLLLFIVTFTINIISHRIFRRQRKRN